MPVFMPWGGRKREAASADFDFALTQEILRTELIRIKALIATAASLGVIIWTIYIVAPDTVSRIWMGHLKPVYLYSVLVPFILFELWVHAVISRHIDLHHDVPVFRRYLGALIETSMPTIALALHMDAMGSVQALGFVVPLTYFIFIILSTLRLDFWLSAFTGFVAAAELLAMAMLYHPDPPPDLFYNSARSLILLVGGILAGAVGMQLRRQFEASIRAATARDRITNLFGQHVSPAVVEKLLATRSELQSEMRPVCVMFVDIRGFTALARAQSAAATVDLLNDFFATMVAIVDRHGGIVNKFLGDGFMAVFGAPVDDGEQCRHAVAASMEILSGLEKLNSAGRIPRTRIGIGLHLGLAVTGNVGGSDRKEYTVIGDVVNLASRIEQATKQFGAQLLVSEAVMASLGRVEGITPRDMGPVELKGQAHPVRVFMLA